MKRFDQEMEELQKEKEQLLKTIQTFQKKEQELQYYLETKKEEQRKKSLEEIYSSTLLSKVREVLWGFYFLVVVIFGGDMV